MTGLGLSSPLARWEGEEVRDLERRWGLPLLEVHDVLASTNDRVRELAREGASPLTTVIANEQTEGRGRQGRKWHSPKGRGLWLSMLLDRVLPPERVGVIPLLAGVAAARAIERTGPGISIGIEWPNDLMCGNRKIGGILCEAWEAEDRGVALAGIGINLFQGQEELETALGADARRAGSVRMLSGRELSPGELAEAVVKEMKRLVDPPPAALEGEIAEELARRDTLSGRRVAVTPGGSGSARWEGVARGIDPDGALLLLDAAGELRRITAGSVRAIE